MFGTFKPIWGLFNYPEIESGFDASRNRPAGKILKSGWLGNFLPTLLLPGKV